ncbi:MAG TPA: lactate utilization protein [Deltaproteobacteria bacterium]|nr:lactate utilization protein [Deltaproteobacteria bacterium]
MGHVERAARFVADPERTRWHDEALWHVRTRRDAAARLVPDWEDLREQAAAIKRHALGRLPELWQAFETNASRAGTIVHWARDAREHNEIVYRLLQERGIRRVVKSKSMLTEECGLNPHLGKRGIEIVDTDLGERIVQLRREAPSHIVMPAIHLRRREIGELFEREMGGPKGIDDPEALTALARRDLRARFLAAEAGLTGVNFAVAETGGFVVVTNEGNADLGTALPDLHIASVGLEKILPKQGDLAPFLRLLARSATGQAMTAYTSHFRGPRPPSPAAPPDRPGSDGRRDPELHIVIVDNGRSRLLGTPAFREALACIRCGACLNTCPVYRRSGGHSYEATIPGPIGSVLETARDSRTHAELPFACSLCGSCSEVCPVRIPLHRQLLAFRESISSDDPHRRLRRWGLDLLGRVMLRPAHYERLGRWGRAFARRLPGTWLEGLLGPWTRHRSLPTLPSRSFRELHRERVKARAAREDGR